MMSRQAKISILAAQGALVCLCFVIGCATAAREKIVTQPVAADAQGLRVGVTPIAPPIIFKQGQKITGVEAELAKKLAKELDKSEQFVVLEWDDLIPALLDNRIDIIMSGMTVTTMREVRIAFTNPYLRVGQMALVRRKDLNKYTSAPTITFSNTRVGVEKGTTGDFLVQQEFPYAQRVPFESVEKGAQALIEGGIDMLIYDAQETGWIGSEKEAEGLAPVPTLLTNENLAWDVRRDDRELLKSVNSILQKWEDNGSLRELIKHWMPYAN